MKINNYCSIAILLLSAIFMTSCEKETKSDGYPEITILNPENGNSFQMLDSIYVSAQISSSKMITSVSVGLTNSANVPVQESIIIQPNASSYYLSFRYELTNYLLESGTYYLVVKASNGSNIALQRKQIHIQASPEIKKGYYIFSDNGFQTTFAKVDTGFVQQTVKSLSGSYCSSAISSYYQQLFVAGGANQNFQSFDLLSHQIKWTVPITSPGQASYTFCESDGKNVCLGFTNGQLKRYNASGITLTNFNYSSGDFFPVLGEDQDENYIGYYESAGSPGKKIVVFNSVSGTPLLESPLSFTVNGIFEKSSSEIYLTGNDLSNHGVLYILNTLSAGLFSPINLPAAKLLSTCQLGNNDLLMAFDDGSIYLYQHSNSNLIAVASGVNAMRMKYSPSEDIIYVAEGMQLKLFVLNGFSLEQVRVYSSPTIIKDFQIIYNK